MSVDNLGPIGPRPIEAIQPHRRVEERSQEEREPPERHGGEPHEDEADADVEDDGLPHLDIRI